MDSALDYMWWEPEEEEDQLALFSDLPELTRDDWRRIYEEGR